MSVFTVIGLAVACMLVVGLIFAIIAIVVSGDTDDLESGYLAGAIVIILITSFVISGLSMQVYNSKQLISEYEVQLEVQEDGDGK